MEIGMTERPTLNDGSGWALNPECFYLKFLSPATTSHFANVAMRTQEYFFF